MKKKKQYDIDIKTMKGVLFLFWLVFVGVCIGTIIIINILLYKDYQRDKLFWSEISDEDFGECSELSFFVSKCNLKYNSINETEVCSIALKYMRKEIINNAGICNFKIK